MGKLYLFNADALVAISKGMQVQIVKLFCNEIIQFLTGVAS